MDTIDKLRVVKFEDGKWTVCIPDELLNKSQAKKLRYNAIFYPANYNREDQDGTYISKLSEMSQILLSPVALHDWRQSLRIDCVLLEKPQILYRLLETLQDFGLDIIVDTSRSIQLNRFHYLSIIASAHSLTSKFLVVEEKVPELVTQAILTKHMDFLAFRRIYPAGKYEPAVKCYWLTGYQHLEGQERDGSYFNERITIDGNCMKVPERWNDYIKFVKSYDIEYPDDPRRIIEEKPQPEEELRYIVHTDSNNQIISIYFPHDDLEICSVIIEVRDIRGSIASILRGLAGQNINILSTFLKEGVPFDDNTDETNAPQGTRDETAHFEILCHLLDQKNFDKNREKTRDKYGVGLSLLSGVKSRNTWVT